MSGAFTTAGALIALFLLVGVSTADEHRKRGLMCRKGSKLVITPANSVYLPGRKTFKEFTEVPTKGTVTAWNGVGFTIPIRTAEDANNYIRNATLFPAGPMASHALDVRASSGRRYVVPKFEYRAPVTRNETTGQAIAYPTARPMDYMKLIVSVFDGRTATDIAVELDIDVVNTRPRAIPATVGVVGNKPRYVTLPAHDIDQRNTPEIREITRAWVSAPSDPALFPCKLSFDANAAAPFDFAAQPAYNVSVETLAVWLTPPVNSEKYSCVFNFTVADREGLVSATPKIIVIDKAASKPHAYGNEVRMERGRRTVSFDLFGATGNVDESDDLTFVITHLPERGKVFKLRNLQEEPRPEDEVKFAENKAEVIVSSSPSRRVRLVYQADATFLVANTKGSEPGKVLPVLEAGSNAASDNIHLTFYVQDKFEKSEPAELHIRGAKNGAAPVCNSTDIYNVIQTASALVQLDYGYAAPGGRMVALPHIQRVMLLSAPRGDRANYGHLVQTVQFENGSSTRTLSPGDHFTDADRNLRWVPNPNVTYDRTALQRPLVYRYRAITPEGLFCDGKVSIWVKPQADPDGGDYGHTWLDRASTGGLHLFVMRASDLPAGSKMAAARINNMDNFQGKLWRVNDSNVPVSRLPLNLGTGKRLLTVCRVVDCTQFKLEERISTNDVITATTDSRTGFSQVLFLYEPPAKPPVGTGENPTQFEFSYKVSEGADWSTGKHFFKIYIAQGPLPQLEFKYDPPQDRGMNMSDAADLRVPITFGDVEHGFPASKFKIRVRSLTGKWRHNAKPTFKLLQVGAAEGDTYIPGNELAPGIKGGWIEFNNTLLLVPTARTRTKVFKFRVSIYAALADGSIPAKDAKHDTYRVIVRQRNHVPKWDIGGPEGTPTAVTTLVGSAKLIRLALSDDDDDALSFRLLKAPKYGFLRYPRVTLGVSSYRRLYEGMTFRIRKGSVSRQETGVVYQCDGAARDPYPLSDEMVIVADDGSGVLSNPMTIRVRVEASEQALSNRERPLPSATVAIVGIVIFLVVVVGATVAVVRRQRFKVYQALAGNDPANAPHPGVNS